MAPFAIGYIGKADVHAERLNVPSGLMYGLSSFRKEAGQLRRLMAKRNSAGFLLYRIRSGTLEVFLVHPGGPFWAKKDAGAWSIPKGEFEEGADPLETAKREFFEETGSPIDGRFVALTPQKQRSGKLVRAWAVEGDIDASSVKSNTLPMEWPPHSGKQQEFPEIDKGEWFTIPVAREKLLAGQRGFLDELQKMLGIEAAGPRSS